MCIRCALTALTRNTVSKPTSFARARPILRAKILGDACLNIVRRRNVVVLDVEEFGRAPAGVWPQDRHRASAVVEFTAALFPPYAPHRERIYPLKKF